MSIKDQIWPLAKREGMKNRDDLDKLDLRTVEVGPNGRLIVPPLLFSQERAKNPQLFKRASEMSASERAEFISVTKSNNSAMESQRAASGLPPVRPQESDHFIPANKRYV